MVIIVKHREAQHQLRAPVPQKRVNKARRLSNKDRAQQEFLVKSSQGPRASPSELSEQSATSTKRKEKKEGGLAERMGFKQ